MFQDPSFYIVISAITLAMVGVIATAGLRGWRDWIDFKRAELESMHRPSTEGVPSAVSRSSVATFAETSVRTAVCAANCVTSSPIGSGSGREER